MDKCIDQAERFLVLRDHNESELRKKLSAKGYSVSEIDKTIDYLKKNHELDEERYVFSFVRSNNRKHPEGKFILFQRLMAKGAERSVVTQVLDSIYTEEYSLILLEQAYDRLKDCSSEIVKAKLAKAGFSLSQINNFLSNL